MISGAYAVLQNSPNISVIMTSFQHAKYISSSISSVLAQTFDDFELIIVDDGSNDGTRSIIESFDDGRIVRHFQENTGPGAALNRALSMSRGKFVAFLSGDDECEPTWLSSLSAILSENSADAIFCRPTLIDDNSKILPDDTLGVFFSHNIVDSATALNHFFWYGNPLCAPGTFMRRDAYEKTGSFDPLLYQLQDFEYWIRLAKTCKISFTPERLIRYRIRAAGQNLGSASNGVRIQAERPVVYERLFLGMKLPLFLQAFAAECEEWFVPSSEVELEQLSWCLFLLHSSSEVRNLGWRLIAEEFGRTHTASISIGRYQIAAKSMARIAAWL